VFNQCDFIRDSFFSIFRLASFTIALSLFAAGAPAMAQDCQSALADSSGAVAMSNGDTTESSKGVDEWDGEVVKLTTTLPGELVIQGTGDGAQSSLYTAGSTSPHPLVDSAHLGTGSRELRAVIPAGTHCIQVAPGPGSSGDFEVDASFTDACHLDGADDHGDSFLCATPIEVGDFASGEITSTESVQDLDMFTFVLTSSATVTIASTGGYVTGSLYDSTGALLDSDNTDESSATFGMTDSLAAGRYYIQIAGPNEASYEISVSSEP
jgi:hypothetical protein